MKSIIIKSLKDINLLAVIVFALVWCCQYTLVDNDLWGRLSSGSMYLANGWVLYKDIFAFTDVKPLWVDHEWLSSIIFFLVYKNGGASAILLLKCAFVSVELWLIYLCARLRDDTDKNAIFLILVFLALVPAFISNLRIHDFTYIFFTLWLLILEYSRLKEKTKYLWLLPLTMPLWVNLHAGCIAGIALVCVYAFSQFLQKKQYKIYFFIVPVLILLILVNPYTYHYYTYILEELSSNHDGITEWNPVDLSNLMDFLWFKVLIILTIITYVFSYKYKKFDPVACILLVAFAYFGFKYSRHTILFAITAGVFLYERMNYIYIDLKDKALEVKSDKYIRMLEFTMNKALAIFILILFMPKLLLTDVKKWNFEVSEPQYPVRAVSFIKENDLKGNVLLPFKWGSYVTWCLYPDIKVSVDGRHVVIYPLSTFVENNDFYYARGNWYNSLDKYKIDFLLIDKFKSPVYKKLFNDKNWKTIYSDEYTALIVPQSSNYKLKSKYKDMDAFDYSNSYFLRNHGD